MRKHNGMRPQDIAILLKIISLNSENWQAKDLANELYISGSEMSESLNRSSLASLIDFNKRKVQRLNLFEFIEYGLYYTFPQQPGTMTNGIPTAHSHPFMQKHFSSEEMYVWPDVNGIKRGLAIEPLYPNQIKAVKQDEQLYKLLALVDVMRVGRTREVKVASGELKKMILNG
jgi:hypothetical protein